MSLRSNEKDPSTIEKVGNVESGNKFLVLDPPASDDIIEFEEKKDLKYVQLQYHIEELLF
jgi:hypothetical protein